MTFIFVIASNSIPSMMPFFDSGFLIFNFLLSPISYCDIGSHFSLLLFYFIFLAENVKVQIIRGNSYSIPLVRLSMLLPLQPIVSPILQPRSGDDDIKLCNFLAKLAETRA